MKKLLSAVTSVAMSLSLMAGAFASPVSAAGSNTVSQPINMGGVLDVSANKTAADSVEWGISSVTAAPGMTVTVPVMVSASGLEVAGAQFNVGIDSPIKFVSATTGDAYDTSISSETNGNVLFKRDGGVGKVAANGSVLANLAFTIPDDCAEGTYNIKWSKMNVFDEKGFDITDKVKFGDGAIKVSKDAKNGNVEWVLDNVTCAPGETVNVKAYVNDPDGNGLAVSGAQFHVKSDDGIEFKSLTKGGAYVAPISFDKDKDAYLWFSDSAVVAGNNATILNISYTVPSDTPEGKYDISWADGFVTDTKGFDITSKVKFTNGSITVKKDNGKTDGKVTWEIGNKTNVKAGDTVKLNVKVSDKEASALPVAGAQFMIDAGSLQYAGMETGDAYGKVTSDTEKPNFMFNLGTETKAAADGSTIFTVSIKVPEGTKDGKYPVNWSQVFVSDTKGFDITKNVVLKNGYIVVGDSDVTEGSAKWVIEKKVKAEPGQTVKVKVISEGASDLAVAGAQFALVGTAPTEFVSGSGKPYGIETSSTDGKPNFIFYQENGVVASKNAELLVLEFKVPENTPDGEYPITWSKQYVADEKGFNITDKVEFVNGSILVGDDKDVTTTTTTDKKDNETTTTTAEAPDGSLTWQIDTVKIAQPKDGDTSVQVGIYVSDPKNAKVGVAGAQFQITNKGSDKTVLFKSAVGGKAYGPLDANRVEGDVTLKTGTTDDPLTNSLMFQTEDSNNVAAINGKAVAVLTFTVKKDCDLGTYPIDFTKGKLTVVDEKGFDITSKIVGLGGAIIVYDPDAEGSTTTTTTTVTTTTTTTTVKDEPGTTTTTTVKDEPGTTTTTTVKDEPGTTTTTTVKDEPGTTTTVSDTGTTTVSDTGTTTTTTTPITVTTTTLKLGDIAWEIDTVHAQPGQEVTVKIVVKDPRDTKLGIAGAQFMVNADKTGATGADLTGVSAKSAYGADLLKTDEIRFMFYDTEAHTASNGAVVAELTYKVGENTKAGDEINLSFDKLYAVDEKGFDISSHILPLNGKIIIDEPEITTPIVTDPNVSTTTTTTTTTTTVITTTGDGSSTTSTTAGDTGTTTSVTVTTTTTGDVKDINITTQKPDFPEVDPGYVTGTTTTVAGHVHTYGTIETTVGFYFSHDNGNRSLGDKTGFSPEQVTKLERFEMYEDANGKVQETKLDVDMTKIHFSSATPEKVYKTRTHEGGKVTIDDFKYSVQVWYDDAPLYDKDGNILTVTVYIGVKGDANLDNRVNATDASTVLSYYAEYQGIKSKTKETAISQNDTSSGLQVTSGADPLDRLSAFLADVDLDEYDAKNWSYTKSDRTVNATDASAILTFYAQKQLKSNSGKTDAELWKIALS